MGAPRKSTRSDWIFVVGVLARARRDRLRGDRRESLFSSTGDQAVVWSLSLSGGSARRSCESLRGLRGNAGQMPSGLWPRYVAPVCSAPIPPAAARRRFCFPIGAEWIRTAAGNRNSPEGRRRLPPTTGARRFRSSTANMNCGFQTPARICKAWTRNSASIMPPRPVLKSRTSEPLPRSRRIRSRIASIWRKRSWRCPAARQKLCANSRNSAPNEPQRRRARVRAPAVPRAARASGNSVRRRGSSRSAVLSRRPVGAAHRAARSLLPRSTSPSPR